MLRDRLLGIQHVPNTKETDSPLYSSASLYASHHYIMLQYAYKYPGLGVQIMCFLFSLHATALSTVSDCSPASRLRGP